MTSRGRCAAITHLWGLPAGRGGVNPDAVADAMVGAVSDFAKKQPKSVGLVRIVVFQPEMLAHFHTSMKKMQGEALKSKGFMDTIKGTKAADLH